MKDNNYDPIQENKKFRFGIDNLTENETINNFSEYSDLHDCSDDLSDKGSKKEEYEHAKFAEQQRRNSYKSYNNYNYDKKQVVLLNKNKKIITYILVFFFIILPILQALLGMIIGIVGIVSDEIIDSINGTGDYYNYETEYSNGSVVAEFETQRDSIVVSGKMLSNKELIIETQNTSSYTMLDLRLQIIFYDGENKPIQISDLNINTLFANSKNIQKLYDAPENFERYDFLITQPYQTNRPTVNYEDLEVDVTNDNGSYLTIGLTNNTKENISDAEIAILCYEGDELVGFETRSVWNLKSGKTQETTLYLTNKSYDRIEYFVNDIYIYN